MTLQTAWTAGMETWKQGTADAPLDVLKDRYVERWLLYRGELFLDAWRSNPWRDDPRVYKNISLLWNHTTRVVNFYGGVVYQGELSAEPGEGAIPIRPDKTLSKQQTKDLMAAIDALNARWNWRHQMLLIPKLTAALGDLPVELVDDREKRFPFPRFVWPGYVTEIELDYVGNVTAYTLEYRVTEEQEGGRTTTYTYRKEVDIEAFRYFRDDKPYDYDGNGAVVPNPYDFVPMVWFRHHVDGMNTRGMAATDSTRQMLLQQNSLFSHARDFQHKAFFAPIIVKGEITAAGQTSIHLFPTAAAEQVAGGDGSVMARRLNFLQGTADAGLAQAQFDLGQTLAILERMQDGILATHPEATFFDKLADAQNVTGPGADRIILPVKGQVTEARAGYDTGMAHLYQQAMSMAGLRIANGDWTERVLPDGTVERLTLDRKREAFLPFGPGAWESGAMEFTIKDRPIVIPSDAEKLAFARDAEQLQTRWAMEFSGVPSEDVDVILQEREDRFETALSRGVGEGVYNAPPDDEDVTEQEDE
jgi:hypothetical protein